MTIVVNTSFTPYNTDTLVKPKQPLWMLKNTGATKRLLINNLFNLRPGEYFGVDAANFMIPAIKMAAAGINKEYVIKNETQFTITFPDKTFAANASGFPFFQATLIETSIKILRNAN